MITEMRMLWLIKAYVIHVSHYNHQAQGDYNTEALIFNIATPGGAALPYMAYTGTCRWTGYGFWPPLPWTGYTILCEPVLDRV